MKKVLDLKTHDTVFFSRVTLHGVTKLLFKFKVQCCYILTVLFMENVEWRLLSIVHF
jgi:hypothetical protein